MNFGVDTADPVGAMFTTRELRRRVGRAVDRRSGPARGAHRPRELHQRRTAPRREPASTFFLGLGTQRARLVDYGFFVADTWRVKPTFTLNLGLRYDLQLPFYPRNNSYSKATARRRLGPFRSLATSSCRARITGQSPLFTEYAEGEGAYDMDLNNWAPNFGAAWTLGGHGGLLEIAARQRVGRQRAPRRLLDGLQPARHVGLHRRDCRQPGCLAVANRSAASAISARRDRSSCAT